MHKNTFINLSNIKLNKNFEINDLESVEIKTFKEKVKNNDFFIKNKKKLLISGDVFDAQPLLKSLYKKSSKKIFSKNFKSEIKANFKRALTLFTSFSRDAKRDRRTRGGDGALDDTRRGSAG